MLPPFNIDLLVLEQKDLAGVPRMEVLDIFDGVSLLCILLEFLRVQGFEFFVIAKNFLG